MTRAERLLEKVLCGTSDADIPFSGLRQLLRRLGFQERIPGSHHIFVKDGVVEILNLQSRHGKAKAYQVRQVRNVILKYGLGAKNL